MTTKFRLPYLDYMKTPKSYTTRQNKSPILVGEAETLGKQFNKAKKNRQHSEATLQNLENRVYVLQNHNQKLIQKIRLQQQHVELNQQKRMEVLNENQLRKEQSLQQQEELLRKQQQTYNEHQRQRTYKRQLQEYLKQKRHEVFIKMKQNQVENETKVSQLKEEVTALNALKSNKVKKERLYGQMRVVEFKQGKWDLFLDNYQSRIKEEQNLLFQHEQSIRHLEIIEQSLLDDIKNSLQMSNTLEEQMTLNNSLSSLLHPSGKRQQTFSSNTSKLILVQSEQDEQE